MFSRRYTICVSVFLLALTLRVVLNFTLAYGYLPRPDSLFYQNIAIHLLTQHCFCANPSVSTVDRAPLWPMVIAAIYSLGGEQNLLVRLFLSMVDAATCVLIYLYVCDLFNSKIALLAAAIAIIYPGLFVYTTWLYPETLFTFLVLAFCYSLHRLLQQMKQDAYARFHGWLCLLCGIVLGAMSLQRPNGLTIAALLIPWAILLTWQKVVPWRKMCLHLVAILLTTGAIIAPWTVRNFLVSHTFVPVAVGDGSVLMGAYNNKALTTPGYQGSWINPLASSPAIAKHYPAFCSPTCEVNREDTYQKLAVLWVLHNPAKTLQLLGLHFTNMWRARIKEVDLPTFRFSRRLSARIVLREEDFITPVIIALALLGSIVYLRRWRVMLFPYLVIVATIAQCLYFYGSPRFRAPIEPLLVLFASAFVYFIAQQWAHRQKSKIEATHAKIALPQSDQITL